MFIYRVFLWIYTKKQIWNVTVILASKERYIKPNQRFSFDLGEQLSRIPLVALTRSKGLWSSLFHILLGSKNNHHIPIYLCCWWYVMSFHSSFCFFLPISSPISNLLFPKCSDHFPAPLNSFWIDLTSHYFFLRTVIFTFQLFISHNDEKHPKIQQKGISNNQILFIYLFF